MFIEKLWKLLQKTKIEAITESCDFTTMLCSENSENSCLLAILKNASNPSILDNTNSEKEVHATPTL